MTSVDNLIRQKLCVLNDNIRRTKLDIIQEKDDVEDITSRISMLTRECDLKNQIIENKKVLLAEFEERQAKLSASLTDQAGEMEQTSAAPGQITISIQEQIKKEVQSNLDELKESLFNHVSNILGNVEPEKDVPAQEKTEVAAPAQITDIDVDEEVSPGLIEPE